MGANISYIGEVREDDRRALRAAAHRYGHSITIYFFAPLFTPAVSRSVHMGRVDPAGYVSLNFTSVTFY